MGGGAISRVHGLRQTRAADAARVGIEDQAQLIEEGGAFLPFLDDLTRVIAASGNLLGRGGEARANLHLIGGDVLQRVHAFEPGRDPFYSDLWLEQGSRGPGGLHHQSQMRWQNIGITTRHCTASTIRRNSCRPTREEANFT